MHILFKKSSIYILYSYFKYYILNRIKIISHYLYKGNFIYNDNNIILYCINN